VAKRATNIRAIRDLSVLILDTHSESGYYKSRGNLCNLVVPATWYWAPSPLHPCCV